MFNQWLIIIANSSSITGIDSFSMIMMADNGQLPVFEAFSQKKIPKNLGQINSWMALDGEHHLTLLGVPHLSGLGPAKAGVDWSYGGSIGGDVFAAPDMMPLCSQMLVKWVVIYVKC